MKLRRKFLFIFIVFIILLFPTFKEVYALNNDIIYDIDTFNIDSDNVMHMTGWSFIDHADNWGGKNLKTYIIAYVGSYPGDANIGKCGTVNEKCQKYEVSYDLQPLVNLYLSRCTNGACSESQEDKHLKNLKNGTEKFRGTSCTGNNNGYSGSHCLYYNVGFQVRIDLNSVYKYFFQYTKNKQVVNFRILSSVTIVEDKKKKPIIRSVGLGIHKTALKKSVREKCEKDGICEIKRNFKIESNIENDDSSNIVYKYSKIKFGGIAKKILFTAESGTAKRSSSLSQSSSAGLYFQTYKNFEIDTTKLNDGKSTKTVDFDKGRILKTKVYAVKGKSNGSRIVPGNSSTYYLPVSWGRVSGTFKLYLDYDSLERKYDETKCFCIGGNCDESSCVETDIIAKNCGSSKKNTECSDSSFSSSCEHTISDTYYYKISKDDLNKLLNGTKTVDDLRKNGADNFKVSSGKYGVVSVGNYYYLPVMFHTNIKYDQIGDIKFVKRNEEEAGERFFNNQIVNSGRFFNFSLVYNTTASWDYLSYSNDVSDKNWYSNSLLIQFNYKNSKGDIKRDNIVIYYDFNNNDSFYNKPVSNVESVAVAKHDGTSNGIYYKVVQNSNVLEKFNNESNLDLDVTFPDSNKKVSDGIVGNPGEFNCEVLNVNSSTKSYSCSYVIPQAHSNPPSGNVYYTKEEGYSEMSNKGSLYYIPISMRTGDIFNFNISSSNLSLIDDIVFEYDTTCTVVANNRLAKDNLRYRSIDVSNPFPKANSNYDNIADNWKMYYDKYGFTRITKNSYGNISYQTKLLNGSYESNLKSLEETYGYYTSFNDVDSDGNSKFINDDLFVKVNGNHCKSGLFDIGCDKLQS